MTRLALNLLRRPSAATVRLVALALFTALSGTAMALQPSIVPDDNLKLPSTWKACQADKQCVRIPNGCRETAVNAVYENVARAHSLRVVGDPRAMSCVSPPAGISTAAACVQSSCALVQSRVPPN